MLFSIFLGEFCPRNPLYCGRGISNLIDAKYISDALNGRIVKDGSYKCDCILIEHRQAKLIIKDIDRLEPLIYCQAGCSFVDLVKELSLRGLWPKKQHTYEEKREIRNKIENKEWQKARIWICVYEERRDLRSDEDDIKYKQLQKKYKWKIWADKILVNAISVNRTKGKFSQKQIDLIMKATEILN